MWCVDSTTILVRLNQRMTTLSFGVVLGFSETAQVLAVLGVMVGERKRVDRASRLTRLTS